MGSLLPPPFSELRRHRPLRAPSRRLRRRVSQPLLGDGHRSQEPEFFPQLEHNQIRICRQVGITPRCSLLISANRTNTGDDQFVCPFRVRPRNVVSGNGQEESRFELDTFVLSRVRFEHIERVFSLLGDLERKRIEIHRSSCVEHDFVRHGSKLSARLSRLKGFSCHFTRVSPVDDEASSADPRAGRSNQSPLQLTYLHVALQTAGTNATHLQIDGDHPSTIGSRFDPEFQFCFPSPHLLATNSSVITAIAAFVAGSHLSS